AEDAAPAPGSSVYSADALTGPEELLHRVTPERGDHTRLQREDLSIQVPITGRLLIRKRVAVAGRPALHHIRDEHLRTSPADTAQQLLQQLTCRPDERTAALVLAPAGAFAHE